jgi:hypothetical protein
MTILDLTHAGNYHYERGCKGKIRCESEAEADRGARKMHKIFHKQFDSYHCCFCDGWHVGTRRKRRAA